MPEPGAASTGRAEQTPPPPPLPPPPGQTPARRENRIKVTDSNLAAVERFQIPRYPVRRESFLNRCFQVAELTLFLDLDNAWLENHRSTAPSEARIPTNAQTLERETGIEPATNSLEGCDSTTALLPPSTASL